MPMYFANPIVIYGAVAVVLGALLLIWRRLAKTEEFKAAADLAVKTLVVIGVTWMLLGTGLGFRHMTAHADCKTRSTETDIPKGCGYVIDKFGL